MKPEQPQQMKPEQIEQVRRVQAQLKIEVFDLEEYARALRLAIDDKRATIAKFAQQLSQQPPIVPAEQVSVEGIEPAEPQKATPGADGALASQEELMKERVR